MLRLELWMRIGRYRTLKAQSNLIGIVSRYFLIMPFYQNVLPQSKTAPAPALYMSPTALFLIMAIED